MLQIAAFLLPFACSTCLRSGYPYHRELVGVSRINVLCVTDGGLQSQVEQGQVVMGTKRESLGVVVLHASLSNQLALAGRFLSPNGT